MLGTHLAQEFYLLSATHNVDGRNRKLLPKPYYHPSECARCGRLNDCPMPAEAGLFHQGPLNIGLATTDRSDPHPVLKYQFPLRVGLLRVRPRLAYSATTVKRPNRRIALASADSYSKIECDEHAFRPVKQPSRCTEVLHGEIPFPRIQGSPIRQTGSPHHELLPNFILNNSYSPFWIPHWV